MDPSQKPILVLVNPHSGRGKSLKIYRKHILKILESRGIGHDIFVTTTEIRVREFLISKSLKELLKYQSIMVIGGDGLLYETVNAIMARDDWQQAISIPVGAIPTGSGNGLAYTLINTSRLSVGNQTEAVKLCCEHIIKAEKRSCDLVRIRYGSDNITIWSFLSVGWGLLADIDIDSEWLRFCGEFRFTIYGILRALTSESYMGRLSFKLPQIEPHNSDSMELVKQLRSKASTTCTTEHGTLRDGVHHTDNNQTAVNCREDATAMNGWIHIEDKFACLYAVHQPYVNSATQFSPKSSLTDRLTYLTYIRGRLTTYQVIEFLLAIADGSHKNLSYVTVVPVQSFKFQPLQPSKVVVDGEVIPWTVADGPITAEVVPEALKIAWPEHNEPNR